MGSQYTIYHCHHCQVASSYGELGLWGKKCICSTRQMSEWSFRIALRFIKSLAYGHVPLGFTRSQRPHLDEEQRRPDPLVCWVKLLQSAYGTLVFSRALILDNVDMICPGHQVIPPLHTWYEDSIENASDLSSSKTLLDRRSEISISPSGELLHSQPSSCGNVPQMFFVSSASHCCKAQKGCKQDRPREVETV